MISSGGRFNLFGLNFLPIVGRELRVASRKRSTFIVRFAAAVVGLLLGAGCLILQKVSRTSASQIGEGLFYALAWTCLAAGLTAGLFFTSDCLSEEKREGTLGLLFLTPLRGYDVVLGKLLATSLRGFYALLAVLPILAITLLVGGITAGQYWKSALALVNALFVSLAAGMLVSVISRDSQKALLTTIVLMVLITFGGLLVDGIISERMTNGSFEFFSLSSPGWVLGAAGDPAPSQYWRGVLVTQVLGWGMLALTCLLAPISWQERKRSGISSTRSWAYMWKYGSKRRRARWKLKLTGQPVVWLICRERWQSLVLWVAICAVVGLLAPAIIGTEADDRWMMWYYLGGLLVLPLYLMVASQACRFFVEARRNGFLELILTSPTSDRQIVMGQWRALRRMFGLPVIVLLSMNVAGAALSQLSFNRFAAQVSQNMASATNSVTVTTNGTIQVVTVVTNTAQTVPAPKSLTARSRTFRFAQDWKAALMAILAAAIAALTAGANLLAICWFGMWMGMTSRTANLATLKTILFVQVVPWFVIAFGSGIFAAMIMLRGVINAPGQPGLWMAWYPLLTAAASGSVTIAKDIFFIVWSRTKLLRSLRKQAEQGMGQARKVKPPPLPRTVSPPPIVVAPGAPG